MSDTELFARMEKWTDENSEMRWVEMCCGANLRACVRFKEIDLDSTSDSHEKLVAESEAGTFVEALQQCLEQVKK